MPTIEDTKKKNTEAITIAISRLGVINYDTVSQQLPRMLVEGILTLDHTVYTPSDPSIKGSGGIGRYLVYDHPDKENPLSIWVFVLASGQKTCIHDHKYRGTVTVLSDVVSEKYYEPISEKKAQRRARVDRYKFHTNHDNLDEKFVHQLKCRKGLGKASSATLHIYNMEAHTLNLQSEIVDQRNLDTIFEKARSDEKGRKPYEQNHMSFSF